MSWSLKLQKWYEIQMLVPLVSEHLETRGGGPRIWVDVKAAADFARGARQALTKVQSKKTRKRRKPTGVKGGGAKKRLKKEHP